MWRVTTYMNFNILTQIGLNKNEIKVYETLFRLGTSKTGAIMRIAEISSSSTYTSLASLTKRGLVSFQVKNNIKYYRAEVPTDLVQNMKKQTSALETLTKELSQLPITHQERNEINMYQGMEGFKRAYESMLTELKSGEQVSVITYSLYYGKSKQIRTFFSQFDKKLFSTYKCKVRMLVDKNLKQIIASDRPGIVRKYQFKCLPKEYFSPCCFNISESMVVMGVFGSNPVAFTMRNPAIIKSFQANFDLLWNLAKK